MDAENPGTRHYPGVISAWVGPRGVRLLVQYDKVFPGWEDLHAYRVRSHCCDLVVLTTANKEEFEIALELWPNQANDNIEDVLREMGFFAITGCPNKEHETYEL